MRRVPQFYKVKSSPVTVAAAATNTLQQATAAAEAAPSPAEGTALLQLMRFDPSNNTKRIDTYQFHKNQDFMVLDLLTAIKAHQDPTLAFRASCCEGVCGSCAMNINGVNSLACITYADPKVTQVGPLPNFPVLKDMVVDLKGFFKQYEYIRPYIRNVHLPQMRVDGIYEKYLATAAALYGERVNTGASSSSSSSSASTTTMGYPGAYLTYMKILDRVVSLGDAAKAVSILARMKREGYVVTDEQARSTVKEALKNRA